MKLQHLTLNTGDSRMSSRDEMNAETFALLSCLLKEKRFKVPGFESFFCEVTIDEGTAAFHIETFSGPIVLCGMAWEEETSSNAWNAMANMFGDVFSSFPQAGMPTSIPWLAVGILPAAALIHPADLSWMGDFERCMAWTILQIQDLKGAHSG